MALVYVVSSPIGKCYVGMTSKTLTYRKHRHLIETSRGSSRPFHNALRKYGDEMVWKIIADGLSVQDAKLLEIDTIASLKSFHPSGYNLTAGGDGVFGHRHSSETRAKLRNAHLGRKQAPEVVAKRTAKQIGRKLGPSPLRGVPRDPVVVAQVAEKNRGQKRPGVGAKVAAKTKGIPKPIVGDKLRRLSISQAANLRILLLLGATLREVAEWFSVSPMTAYNVKTGRRGYQ